MKKNSGADNVVSTLQELLDDAKKGKITNFIFVGLRSDDRDEGECFAQQISLFASHAQDYFILTGATHALLSKMASGFANQQTIPNARYNLDRKLDA